MPDGDGLTTIVMHESGEWIMATAKLELSKPDPQGQGSAITYMRRYALSAALGLVTEDDDDGNAASTPQKPVARPTAAKKPVQASEGQKLAPHKDRIMHYLKGSGLPCSTKKECENSVFELTGLMLDEANYEEIADALAALNN